MLIQRTIYSPFRWISIPLPNSNCSIDKFARKTTNSNFTRKEQLSKYCKMLCSSGGTCVRQKQHSSPTFGEFHSSSSAWKVILPPSCCKLLANPKAVNNHKRIQRFKSNSCIKSKLAAGNWRADLWQIKYGVHTFSAISTNRSSNLGALGHKKRLLEKC